MSFDNKLADRIRKTLEGIHGVSERKMFGGLCFLLGGHMCCGIVGRQLVARVAPDGYDRVLGRPYVQPMDFTGKPLRGFVYVMPDGLKAPRALNNWVGEGVRYARSLPKKGTARGKKRGPRRST